MRARPVPGGLAVDGRATGAAVPAVPPVPVTPAAPVGLFSGLFIGLVERDHTEPLGLQPEYTRRLSHVRLP